MPIDLVPILGCLKGDSAVRKLSEYFEENPEATKFETCSFLEFLGSGFSLMLDDSDRIDCVHIHTLPEDGYLACTEALPFDFSARTTQAEAHQLLGSPTTAGGPVRSQLAPENITFWDRWEYAQHCLHLVYSEQRDSILLITLMSNTVLPESADAD